MNLEFLVNLSEDEAGKLLMQARERLAYNGGRIGQSILEVLEIEIPEGIEPLDFERQILGDAITGISDSYCDKS